jgi:hypothetical protein
LTKVQDVGVSQQDSFPRPVHLPNVAVVHHSQPFERRFDDGLVDNFSDYTAVLRSNVAETLSCYRVEVAASCVGFIVTVGGPVLVFIFVVAAARMFDRFALIRDAGPPASSSSVSGTSIAALVLISTEPSLLTSTVCLTVELC